MIDGNPSPIQLEMRYCIFLKAMLFFLAFTGVGNDPAHNNVASSTPPIDSCAMKCNLVDTCAWITAEGVYAAVIAVREGLDAIKFFLNMRNNLYNHSMQFDLNPFPFNYPLLLFPIHFPFQISWKSIRSLLVPVKGGWHNSENHQILVAFLWHWLNRVTISLYLFLIHISDLLYFPPKRQLIKIVHILLFAPHWRHKIPTYYQYICVYFVDKSILSNFQR